MFFHDLFYFWRRSFFIHCLGSCHPFLKHIVYKKNHTLLKRNGACPQLEIRSNHLVATKVARFAELRLEIPAVQYFWCHDRSKDISKRILLRPRPHYTGGVSKRKLDYENTSDVFYPQVTRGISKRNYYPAVILELCFGEYSVRAEIT